MGRRFCAVLPSRPERASSDRIRLKINRSQRRRASALILVSLASEHGGVETHSSTVTWCPLCAPSPTSELHHRPHPKPWLVFIPEHTHSFPFKGLGRRLNAVGWMWECVIRGSSWQRLLKRTHKPFFQSLSSWTTSSSLHPHPRISEYPHSGPFGHHSSPLSALFSCCSLCLLCSRARAWRGDNAVFQRDDRPHGWARKSAWGPANTPSTNFTAARHWAFRTRVRAHTHGDESTLRLTPPVGCDCLWGCS